MMGWWGVRCCGRCDEEFGLDVRVSFFCCSSDARTFRRLLSLALSLRLLLTLRSPCPLQTAPRVSSRQTFGPSAPLAPPSPRLTSRSSAQGTRDSRLTRPAAPHVYQQVARHKVPPRGLHAQEAHPHHPRCVLLVHPLSPFLSLFPFRPPLSRPPATATDTLVIRASARSPKASARHVSRSSSRPRQSGSASASGSACRASALTKCGTPFPSLVRRPLLLSPSLSLPRLCRSALLTQRTLRRPAQEEARRPR